MITVYTRSFHADLYSMMLEFVPEGVKTERMTNYDDWTDALSFIKDVINKCDGYAVILDEDCFTYNFGRVLDIVSHMEEHGYTHAGMPDRGVSPHRTLMWTTLNPFFNVINCPAIRKCGGLDTIDKPHFMNAPTFEIFDDLYLQMWKVGKPLYLNAATTSDGLTTHLMDHKNNFFALHAWMSRDWKRGQRERIMNVYKTAKEWQL